MEQDGCHDWNEECQVILPMNYFILLINEPKINKEVILQFTKDFGETLVQQSLSFLYPFIPECSLFCLVR